MANYMERAFAEAEAQHRNKINIDTWGHLFPEKKQYKGKIRVANSLYGSQGIVILDEKDLPRSSPWWYDAINDFVYKVSDDINAGEVVEFDIQVDIVHCIEELEDWEIEEEAEPDEWEEIRIKQIRKATIVKAWP
jgi:hypothetical protein